MKIFKTLPLIAGLFVLAPACKKNVKGPDKELYDLSKSTDGYIYYKNSKTIQDKSTASGHSDARMVTRFNSVAAAMLDSNGKVKNGITFPDNSIIVKELYSKKDNLRGYAVMYKKAGDPNADANNWVWAVYTENAKVRQSVSKKGDGCIGCHNGSGNIDLSLMNVYFP